MRQPGNCPTCQHPWTDHFTARIFVAARNLHREGICCFQCHGQVKPFNPQMFHVPDGHTPPATHIEFNFANILGRMEEERWVTQGQDGRWRPI